MVKRDKYASAYLADNLALGESVNDRIDGKGSAGGSIDIWLAAEKIWLIALLISSHVATSVTKEQLKDATQTELSRN